MLMSAAPPETLAQWKSVSVEKANVRAQPSGRSDVLWQVYIYTPFKILGRKGNWIRIRNFRGFKGWVHATVLGDTPSVIVKTKKANVREGPGAQYAKLWQVDFGYTFEVLERQGAWLRIKDEEDLEGWIHSGIVWGNELLEAAQYDGTS